MSDGNGTPPKIFGGVPFRFEMKVFLKNNSKFFCALLTALLLWIPVQKWGLFPLAWIGLTPLFWAASDMDSKTRLCYGWRAGFLFYALTNWWILPTIIYGSPMIGAPPALGVLLGVVAVSFIAAVHGWQFALALWLWDTKKWARHLWLLPIVVALFWGFFDYVRCIPPLAHIWGALAFTQWRNISLLQSAPYIGQHGITILLVWLGANLTLYAVRRRFVFLAPLFIFIFVALHGWFCENWISVDYPSAPPNVLLVSTNVPSLSKTRAQAGESNFQQALRLTNKNLWQFLPEDRRFSPQERTIVWPETTFEVWKVDDHIRPNTAQIPEWNRLQKMLIPKGKMQFLSGIAVHELDNLDEKLYNSAVLLGKNPKMQMAPKIRTVPMGEKAPFGEYLPFLRRLAPDPEVTPGTTPKPLNLHGTPIGTIICFESCFPDPARSLKAQGAQALFIVTNDEYFKGTNAPWEHATMAILRAAENQIPVAQVANGGYTLLIDSHGRLLHQSFGAEATPVNIPLH